MDARDAYERLTQRIAAIERALAEVRGEVEGLRANAPRVQPPPSAAPVQASVAPPPPISSVPPPAQRTQRKIDERTLVTRGLLFAGLLLLLFGSAFGLQLAFAHDLIGPHARIALGLLAGLGVLFGGARLRAGLYVYLGEGLIGLGAGLLYLSLWAATNFYHFIPPPVSAVAMFAVTVVLAVLAYARASERVAFLGLVGGYLTPLLLQNGPVDRISLAGYLLILTGVMLALAQIARFNFVEAGAFVGVLLFAPRFATSPDSTIWGWPQSLMVATLFFVEFSGALFFGARRSTELSIPKLVLAVLNVGAYLLILATLLEEKRTVHGLVLLAVAAVLLAAVSQKRIPALMQATYAWLAVAVVTIAIPVFFDGSSVTRLLAVEAALIAAFANRARDSRILLASAILFCIALVLALADSVPSGTGRAFLSERFATNAVVLVSLVYTSRLVAPWSALTQNGRLAHGIGVCAAHAFAIFALTIETVVATGSGTEIWTQHAQLAVSLLWTAYAAAIFGLGLVQHNALWRRIGLALFCLTVIKAFFYDLASLELAYRVLSLGALGVVLVVASTLYQRSAARESL